MGGELRIRIADERTPPPIEGLDADDGEWALSLEAHRELLIDIAGVEPTAELTLRELETIRSRLEGYVEREKRASTGTAPSTSRRESTRESSTTPLRRLLARLLEVVPLVGTRAQSEEPSERRPEAQRPYSVTRVRRLARVFRIAIDARRDEISTENVERPTDATVETVSATDAAAD